MLVGPGEAIPTPEAGPASGQDQERAAEGILP